VFRRVMHVAAQNPARLDIQVPQVLIAIVHPATRCARGPGRRRVSDEKIEVSFWVFFEPTFHRDRDSPEVDDVSVYRGCNAK